LVNTQTRKITNYTKNTPQASPRYGGQEVFFSL
jgi:hypothetical protein